MCANFRPQLASSPHSSRTGSLRYLTERSHHHLPLYLWTSFPGSPVGITVRNSFRMNTCKSVSKQTTLTSFRMNTYTKTRGRAPSMSYPIDKAQGICRVAAALCRCFLRFSRESFPARNKFCRIISFADPPRLTSIDSYRFKNVGGRGWVA